MEEIPAQDSPPNAIGQQLQYKDRSTDQSQLLDAIDELTQLGLRSYLSLPQIVVCGDQSSGKSSVLEAISHIRFPTRGSLCTTFATEVAIRRTKSPGKPVRIIPGASRRQNAAAQKRLLQFPGDSKYDGPEDIPSLIEAAKETMSEASGTSVDSFFDDRLHVHVHNPSWPPVTIVDLPGYIHSPNQGQTKADVDNVHKMVDKYLSEPRSIVLAIVDAQNEYANQVVLSRVKAADPTNTRTLGVITKPDTLRHKDDETVDKFIKLAMNKSQSYEFNLGWHVLKNRDPRSQNQSAEERDASEKDFFSTEPWSTFDNQKALGVDALRLRLSSILHEHIVSNLPDIIVEIKRQVHDTEVQLARLGDARSEPSQKQKFLANIAQDFQKLAYAAVNGSWNDVGGFFGNPYSSDGYETRLRAVVQNLNDDFVELISRKGHSWFLADDDLLATVGLSFAFPEKGSYVRDARFANPKWISRNEFVEKIEEVSRKTRGKELTGVPNPNTIGELFREQSSNWRQLAEHHVETVCAEVQSFVMAALRSVTDAYTYARLLCDYINPKMNQKRELAMKKLDEVLTPFTRSHPISYNMMFLKALADIKTRREQNVHEGKAGATQVMNRYGATDIVDTVWAYYYTSINTFIDNVACLVIENCLVNDLDQLFSASEVLDMDAELLDRLASESEESQESRMKLKEKLECLRKGLRICEQNQVHVSTLPKPKKEAPVRSTNVEIRTTQASSSPEDASVQSDNMERSLFPTTPPSRRVSHNRLRRSVASSKSTSPSRSLLETPSSAGQGPSTSATSPRSTNSSESVFGEGSPGDKGTATTRQPFGGFGTSARPPYHSRSGVFGSAYDDDAL